MSEEQTEDQIMDSIMSQIIDEPQEEVIEKQPQEIIEEQAPQVEEAIEEEQPPIQQDIPPDAIPQNELVPSKTEELLGQLVQQNQELKDALQPQEPQVELTEEEQALQELGKKLGLDDKLAEVEALKEQLAQQQQFMQQQLEMQQQEMQMKAQAQEAMQVLGSIKKDYGVTETDLANKIDELIKVGEIPADMRENPTVWRLTAQTLKVNNQPQQAPDAITSTQTSSPRQSAIQSRRSGGDVDDMSIVAEVLEMAKQR